MMFELYYSTGGHGGPHRNVFDAKTSALRLLAGNHSEKWIDIKSRGDNLLVARITREHLKKFYQMGGLPKPEPKFQAVFSVTATVLLEGISDMELNNSKVLHPDVLDKLMMQLQIGIASTQITLDEAFEYGTKGGQENG